MPAIYNVELFWVGAIEGQYILDMNVMKIVEKLIGRGLLKLDMKSSKSRGVGEYKTRR